MNQEMTKAGWTRFVREVAALEDAAADGNTWGPEQDAAILASLAFAGRRKAPKPQVEVWAIHASSSHFTFEAYGSTPTECFETFRKLLKRHQAQTGAEGWWVEEMLTDYHPFLVRLGVGYRDGEEITR